MQRGYARNKQERATQEAAGVSVVYDYMDDAVASLRKGDVLTMVGRCDIWTQCKANAAGCNVEILEAGK